MLVQWTGLSNTSNPWIQQRTTTIAKKTKLTEDASATPSRKANLHTKPANTRPIVLVISQSTTTLFRRKLSVNNCIRKYGELNYRLCGNRKSEKNSTEFNFNRPSLFFLG